MSLIRAPYRKVGQLHDLFQSLKDDVATLSVRLKEDWKKWLWPTAEGVMGVPLWTKVSDEVMMEMLPSTSRSLATHS